jgi:hypothetical protein
VAIALPWLEIMGSERRAAAAATPAQRFLAVYTPGGTVLDRWRPTGNETDFALSPILAPLEPVLKNIIIVDGLDMKSASGEQRQAGLIAWMTGTAQMNQLPTVGSPGTPSYAQGPSIEQVLARRISATKKKQGLQIAVRWGTGVGHGIPFPGNIANFAVDANFSPVVPEIDPMAIWQGLFGTLGDDVAPRLAWDKSILDAVSHRYQSLAPRLGTSDKQKIEAHLEKIREMEQRLAPGTGTNCSAPTFVDTTGYDPHSGLHQDASGNPKDLATDAAIPAVGKLMMDMMVMAFACDLTAVGTLQWADTPAKYTLPWLNLPEHHYFYQNDGGYQPVQLEMIYTWYSQQHAYLLQEMAKIDMGGHTLLDESVVFFGSEVQNPATNAKTDMPFLLAGGGGGLRGGRWVRYNHEPHNNLLVSILNLFGDSRTTFGTPTYCTGPLTNLT